MIRCSFTLILTIQMLSLSVQFPGQSELRASVESSSGSEQCGRLNETQLYSQTKHTSLDEYPWLGRIKYFKNNYEPHYQCLAVLFKAQWALFPAHCVPTTKELEMYSVLFGDWNATDDVKTGDCNNLGECAPPPQEYLIEEIAVHPNYNLRQYAHDIALVKLAQPVRLSEYIQPICLLPPGEDANEYIAQRLEVVGFPVRLFFQLENVRTKAHMQTTSQEHCKNILPHISTNSNQICGFINADTNLISGSAIMGINIVNGKPNNFYLVGFITYGSRIKSDRVPSVFMRIWPYREWILFNSI